MTDLTTVLPSFPINNYVRLLPSLEKRMLTTADLLTLDSLEIAKRAHLPVLDVKKLCNDVHEALQASMGLTEDVRNFTGSVQLRKTGEQVVESWSTISLLDADFDRALNGGIPTGSITELTGESGAGKTQVLLTLLLSAQLPPPKGLSGTTLYLSTESPLPVTRVKQLLLSHPELSSADPKPSLDRIKSIVTSDLESQDHIIHFQVPVAIKRYGVRLLIIDSIAANYRVELDVEQKSGNNMARRSLDLVKLGNFLRNLAQEMDIAIVVANQVADRISNDLPRAISPTQEATRQPSLASKKYEVSQDYLSLNHQQRWFTGWGDDHQALDFPINLKTPSLGLIWTTQIACRIALIKSPHFAPITEPTIPGETNELILQRWSRWLKVVFASHAPESGEGIHSAVEFEIKPEGLQAVKKAKSNAIEFAKKREIL
ncbi:hypothetical protein K3495_g10095 [Podosphaera aphanis]|nr:hypothetical protein K3495_g10095 [Podosphaera aphanis]